MRIRFKAICQRVIRNNETIEALFSRYPTAPTEHQSDALFNVAVPPGAEPERGRAYWVSIDPAFPH